MRLLKVYTEHYNIDQIKAAMFNEWSKYYSDSNTRSAATQIALGNDKNGSLAYFTIMEFKYSPEEKQEVIQQAKNWHDKFIDLLYNSNFIDIEEVENHSIE